MVTVPGVVVVYVTEHVLLAVVPFSAHVPANVPVLLVVNETVPVGVLKFPGEVSATMTLQLVATLVVAGEVHDTVAVVVRRLTVIAADLLLVPCDASPPYDPVIVATPVAEPVKLTLHDPIDREQLVGPKVPAEPVLVNATVPVGVLAPAPFASATVAVHVDAWPIATVFGEHETVVDVVRGVTVTVVLPLVPL